VHGDSLSQTEADVYGSSRLGLLNLSLNCSSLSQPDSGSLVRGNKLFELTNHLGNVLETISDKKIQHTSDNSTVDYYLADVIGANDYYSFGMEMPGRSFTTSTAANYRYGFNGQEKTDEIAGAGNHNTAEFWEYDTRIGRRWSLDPKPTVGISEYSVFKNSPILLFDPLGDSAGDPIMPRHPIDLKNSPSDLSYLPYNAIGALFNTGQALLNKAGQYTDHPVEQLNTDVGNIGDFFVSQWDYFTKTPVPQLKKDATDFFSNPDNYFHAAEDAFATIVAGRFSLPEAPKISKITAAEEFTLNPIQAASADGSYYSVAYETNLPSNLFPGRSYATHFSAANKALHAAMASDETFSATMSDLGMTFKRTKTGAIDWTRSPNNFVWHHSVEEGIMQLVPKIQHSPSSIHWNALHPFGEGGMSIWGR
jgi:hypothetical protein